MTATKRQWLIEQKRAWRAIRVQIAELKVRGVWLAGPFAMASDSDLCVLSLLVNGSDPNWDERFTLVVTEKFLAARFDLEHLPPGALFLKGEAARKFIEESERNEARFQAEQALRRKFGGNN